MGWAWHSLKSLRYGGGRAVRGMGAEQLGVWGLVKGYRGIGASKGV